MSREHRAVLGQVERKFDVQRRFLLALWGMETRYGRVTGNTPVFQALATLAWEPRRASYFRGELFNALTMVQRGHIEARVMTGSWAGAMGQTQFMPSSYLSYAVDFDGDGRRDIWKSTGDALASIANYLKGFGGTATKPGAVRSRCPTRVRDEIARTIPKRTEGCYAVRNMTERRPLDEWQKLGVRLVGWTPAAARDADRGARRCRRAHVPRLSELRRDPRLQLRALLRADRRALVGPTAMSWLEVTAISSVKSKVSPEVVRSRSSGP